MGVPLSCRGGSGGHLLGGPSKVLMVGPTKAAIVFVIDSAKPLQLKLAKLDLWEILQENELKLCPLLVIANKQDSKESLPVENVSDEMGLSNIQDRMWSIIAISALETEGVDKALRELCRLLDEHRASMP
ncbi:ADP-ribosylation factor 11 [Octopus vulgaris]|uniref:ADP-ribosylation factor 11 n=1 Tax=Octopus vulgaris TaxID=6645 RepID=A0AA36B9J8_OCTVU|nr:ADP-ribosylation factor 11 [Octopus vulgaris]